MQFIYSHWNKCGPSYFEIYFKMVLIIYDIRGNIISKELYEIDNSPKKVDDLFLAFPPGKFRKGIYLFRIEVSSTLDQAKGSAIERLIINN